MDFNWNKFEGDFLLSDFFYRKGDGASAEFRWCNEWRYLESDIEWKTNHLRVYVCYCNTHSLCVLEFMCMCVLRCSFINRIQQQNTFVVMTMQRPNSHLSSWFLYLYTHILQSNNDGPFKTNPNRTNNWISHNMRPNCLSMCS